MRIGLWLALGLLVAPTAALAAKVGKPAPAFTLTTYDGETVSLESLRGRVVLLNFWATWCGPCNREMPQIDTYLRRHRNAPLSVYAVTVDNEVPYDRLRFLAETLAFPLIKKMKGGGYGVLDGVPTNYVIDKAGVVRYAKSAAFDLDDLESVVSPLLAEPAPAAPTAVAARE